MVAITCTAIAQVNYAKLVNPFVGTGGHGHTYPGATLPHGMVQLSPDTRLEGWDGCGGYHYDDQYIYGFTHTHLSGTGIPDYCDILLMPMAGKPSADNKVYGSSFSHQNEQAWAGYYSVLLNKGNIKTEFTATERVGMHHYTFSSDNDNTIIIDLKHRDEVLASTLKLEDAYTVSGMRRSKSWAQNQYVYFVIKFSKPIINKGLWNNEQLTTLAVNNEIDSKNIKAFFQFDLKKDKNIYVKVALSPVSVEGAKRNLNAELPGWDFQKTTLAAMAKWNKALGKIEVKGDKEKMKIFYTALYHTEVVPNINMDVDGQYRGMDNNIHKAVGFTYYSVFSLWDTYRGAHPLYTIVDQQRTTDYIKTFLTQYKEGGRLPVWELASNETECMIGYHSVPVIADAYAKGINIGNPAMALQAMQHSANLDHFGLSFLKQQAVIQSDDEQESVSKTLEYAYDDWCIAQTAKLLGNTSIYNTFIKRAQNYKNVFDSKLGYMRPRKNGDWLSPFDPKEVNNNYTEANSWQYSFYMPQDVGTYIKMLGGVDKMAQQLNTLFTTTTATTGREQSDITGLIGQYAHGNEPSHHIAYLYNYCNAPNKTQQLVHQICSEFYKNTPDGLIGNEDCGQMSAWYVLSAMGFYQVTPGTTLYNIGTPAFEQVLVHLENGKTFTIKANNLSGNNYYVGQIKLNNANQTIATNNLQIDYKDMMKGATLVFGMTDKPAPANIFTNTMVPTIKEDGFVINPIIEGAGTSFRGNKNVAITTVQPNCTIYYTEDGTVPTTKSDVYKNELIINKSLALKAIAVDDKGNSSAITTANYKKIDNNWTVTLNSKYEQMYDAGGAEGLVDGIRGSTNWRKGNWQGYQKTDFSAMVDLKTATNISEVSIGFMQDTRAWIVMPKAIKVEVSLDGQQFTTIGSLQNILPIEDLEAQLKSAVIKCNPTSARYVRVTALQYGKLPSWHEGAGGDTHIFVDEIEIK